jgi:hypothetical protein
MFEDMDTSLIIFARVVALAGQIWRKLEGRIR